MVPFFVAASKDSQDATQSFCTVSLRRCMRTVHVFGGGRECGFVVCRPRLGRFLWLGVEAEVYK